MNYLLAVLLILTFTKAFATSPVSFTCDMRDLSVNDTNTGLIKLELYDDRIIMKAGVAAKSESGTLWLAPSASISSSFFVLKNERGRIEKSFDLLPSRETGILIWHSYDWEKPQAFRPFRSQIHICNKN